MSWRNFCATSQPPSEGSDHTTSQSDPESNFVDFVDFVPEEKNTLSLKSKTPVGDSSDRRGLPAGVSFHGNDHKFASSAKSTESTKPIQPGWLVTYRTPDGQLAGGAEDRQTGTVTACTASSVQLTNGATVQLNRIVGAARTDASGAVLAAWLVARHGLDGSQEATT